MQCTLLLVQYDVCDVDFQRRFCAFHVAVLCSFVIFAWPLAIVSVSFFVIPTHPPPFLPPFPALLG